MVRFSPFKSTPPSDPSQTSRQPSKRQQPKRQQPKRQRSSSKSFLTRWGTHERTPAKRNPTGPCWGESAGQGAIALIFLLPCLLALGYLLISLLGWNPGSELINWGGRVQLWQFLRAAAHPDLSLNLLRVTGAATLTTLSYAICGSALSLILGSIGGVLCSEVGWSLLPGGLQSQNSPWKRVSSGLRGLLTLPRAIHEMVWGLILIHLWGTDPLTGIVAIALPFGAATAKIFSEILDDTPRETWRSLLNSGASPITAFSYGLLPLAFLNLTSYAFYRFECSLRSAAVLGMIGVGGLGTEIHVSLQSLRYEQLWTFFYALILLNSLVDWTSAHTRHKLGCTSRLTLNQRPQTPNSKTPNSKTPDPQTPNSKLSTLNSAFLLLPLLSLLYLHPNLSLLVSHQTLDRFQTLALETWPLDLGLIPQLPGLIWQTLVMSILAIALASCLGTVLSFTAARTLFLPGGLFNPSRSSWDRQLLAWLMMLLSRGLLLLGRAIPSPVWALVLLYVLFPGIWPGAIALAIHNLGILGRLQAEVIENLNPTPLNALQNQGIAPPLIFCYGIFPLTLPPFLAYGLYRWEVCLRETIIVGLVGAGGLGYLMLEQVSSFDYSGLAVTLLCFSVLTWAVDLLSKTLRQRLR